MARLTSGWSMIETTKPSADSLNVPGARAAAPLNWRCWQAGQQVYSYSSSVPKATSRAWMRLPDCIWWHTRQSSLESVSAPAKSTNVTFLHQLCSGASKEAYRKGPESPGLKSQGFLAQTLAC